MIYIYINISILQGGHCRWTTSFWIESLKSLHLWQHWARWRQWCGQHLWRDRRLWHVRGSQDVSGRWWSRNMASWAPRTVLSYTITSSIVTGNYYRVKLKLCSIVGSSVLEILTHRMKWCQNGAHLEHVENPYLGFIDLGSCVERLKFVTNSCTLIIINLHDQCTSMYMINLHWCTLLVGGLEHFLFSHILGISSSQLTNSYFSGSNQPPTRLIFSFKIPSRLIW